MPDQCSEVTLSPPELCRQSLPLSVWTHSKSIWTDEQTPRLKMSWTSAGVHRGITCPDELLTYRIMCAGKIHCSLISDGRINSVWGKLLTQGVCRRFKSRRNRLVVSTPAYGAAARQGVPSSNPGSRTFPYPPPPSLSLSLQLCFLSRYCPIYNNKGQK